MPRTAVLCLALALGVPPALASGCGDMGRVRYEPRTFLGYACADDCEHQKAGYAWAETNSVESVRECDRLQGAAAEGCRVRAELPLGAQEAGHRWALENEITDPRLCAGAGARFCAGCLRAVPWFAAVQPAPAPNRGCDAPGRFDPAVPAGKLRR